MDAPNQLFDAILVVEQNRITRTDNDEEEGRILMILKENNIRLVSPHEGILDLNNPIFRLLAKFWASAEERAEITRKMKRGKRQRLLEGKWVSGTGSLFSRIRNMGGHQRDPVQGSRAAEDAYGGLVFDPTLRGLIAQSAGSETGAENADAPGQDGRRSRWAGRDRRQSHSGARCAVSGQSPD